MKKKLTRLYYVFWTFLVAYLFLAFSSNPPNGFTGSPASGSTCGSSNGGCHSGGSGTGFIDITGLPATIDPNTTYPITVSVTRTNNAPNEAGFQMDVLDANNNSFGTLSNPGAGSTVQAGFFEHNPAQPFATNTITYTVDWTSPSSGNTTVTMYAAGLLANGTGGTGGDAVVTTETSGQFMGSAGPINVTVTGTDVSCFGGSDGTATAMAAGGGGGPYTYNWSNGMTGAMISGLTAGSYTVTVTNMSGDPGEATVFINEPATPVEATIIQTQNIDCNNPVGSATVEGSGGTPGYTYEWSNGMNTPTINVSMAGNYEVTVSDVNNCTATALANIFEDTTPPTAEAGAPMAITCSMGTVILDGTASSAGPDITYGWTTADGNIVSGANSTSPEVDQAGTYTITVTNAANGCSATDQTTVISNINLPIVTIAPADDLTCIVNQVTLDGTGSSSGAEFSYLWTTANGNIVAGETTLMPVVDAAGDYTLTVTNSTNGCINSSSVSVSENTTPPVADAGADMALNCNNPSVTLNGSGSSTGAEFSYLWTTTDGNIVSGETTTMPTVDAAGTYVLTVTNNDNGCTAADEVVVTETPAVTASISDTTHVDCNGNSTGSATAAGNGGNGTYSYNWSNGEMTQVVMNLSAGSYTVTVTDDDNCTATASVTITEPTELTTTVAITDVSMSGADDGTATANPMGGTPDYTYEWNTGVTTQTITDLPPGTYTVTVTDENGCTAVGSGTVNSIDCSGFSATVSTVNVTCNGDNDGSATVTPTGGMMPITYNWSDGQTTQTADTLSAGSYSVTVSEENGCTEVLMVDITEPTAVTVSADKVNHVSCHGGNDGSIIISGSGGHGGYTFIWSNSGMGDTLMNLSAGSYTVTATDEMGCVGTLSVTINEPTELSLSSVAVSNATCHGDSTGAASVAAMGGTPTYTYQWPNGGSGPTQSNLSAGDYNVTATDANGCTATLLITITEPTAVVVSITSTDETGIGLNDGTAIAMASGGTSGHTFEWSNGANTAGISGLSPDDYCVTVTDLNGCTATSCTTINAFICAGVSLEINSNNITCFGGNDGSATAVPTGMAAPITYLWSNMDTTASIGNLTAGSYSVTVTGGDGCSATSETTINEPAAIAILGEITNTMCEDSEDGSINVMANGGTPTFIFKWSDGTDGPILEDAPSGNHTVSVTDGNGCVSSQEFTIGTDPDIEIPNVVLQDITVELDANGMATITAAMVDNGSTDNCGIDTMMIDVTDFDCSHLGETQVNIAIQDLSNNCGAGTATVTVVDNMPPSIACPNNIVVEGSSCQSIITYDDPLVSDNCGSVNVSLAGGLPSGATFFEGTTTVTLEATDGSNNTATCSFDVTLNSDFASTSDAADVTCNGFSDGSATADVTGGMLPYTYEWDDANSQTSQTAINLSAGTYNVTVTDSLGCTVTSSVTVNEPPVLEISVDNVVPDTLSNNQGEIAVTVTGGTGDYTYEWESDGTVISMDEDLTGLGTGFYTLTVIDENGCTAVTDSIFIDMINSTDALSPGQHVSFYPNPISDRLTISFNLPTNADVSISVYHLNGQTALPTQVGHFSTKTMELEMGDLPTGIYLVRTIIGEEVLVERVVVERGG